MMDTFRLSPLLVFRLEVFSDRTSPAVTCGLPTSPTLSSSFSLLSLSESPPNGPRRMRLASAGRVGDGSGRLLDVPEGWLVDLSRILLGDVGVVFPTWV